MTPFIRRALRGEINELERLRHWPFLPYTPIAAALILWFIALPAIDPSKMTDIGLLAVLPYTYYLALVILTISFCWNAFRHSEQTGLLLLHLVMLLVMFHATPTIVYHTLRYSWAWKHIGMVDYIQRHGTIDPLTPLESAYHNWPGFFALNALLTELAGLPDALPYAPWATLFFNFLFLGALLIVYRSLTSQPHIVWLATWIFFITNWIGQDYFAPQALAFFFYLLITGILLRWFRLSQSPSESTLLCWLRHPRLAGWVNTAIARSNASAHTLSTQPGQRLILAGLVILLMAVITFSHQLTPFMVLVALILLVLAQVTYLRGLPGVMAIMLVAWLWLAAGAFMRQNITDFSTSLGAVQSNFATNFIDLSRASHGQIIIALMNRGLTLLVMVLAAAGFIRRWRRGKMDLAAILLSLGPFMLLMGNSYGGEIIFRVYMFALPFMAFGVAVLFEALPARLPGGRSLASATALSLIILPAFLFAYYGKDKQYYFSPGEISAAQFMFSNAPAGSLIIEGTRNYPTLFLNYEEYTYVPISREPEDGRARILQNPVDTLALWMENPNYTAAYIIITRSMKAEVDMVGVMPAGSLDAIEAALRRSNRFTVLYSNADAVVFVLKDRQP